MAMGSTSRNSKRFAQDAEDKKDNGADEATEDKNGKQKSAAAIAEDKRDGGKDDASEDANGKVVKKGGGKSKIPPQLLMALAQKRGF